MATTYYEIMLKQVFDVKANSWIAPTLRSCVSKCDSKGCLCCIKLETDNTFKSFSTGCTFTLAHSRAFSCKSRLVIYLISCKVCGLQYVGQTKQPLHKRLNGHRSAIRNNKLSTFLCQHFNDSKHSFDDLSIRIIDAIDPSGKNDDEIANELNLKEDFYMRTLNTFYPMGLNDRKFGGGCVSNSQSTEALYFCSPIPRKRRSHGIRRSGRKRVHVKDGHLDIIDRLHSLFNSKDYQAFYRYLRSIKDNELRFVYYALKSTDSTLACVFTSFYFYHFKKTKEESKVSSREPLIFNFFCRKIDFINLPSIIGDKRINRILPFKLTEHLPLRIFFKLETPTALEFCNYAKLLKNLTLSDIKTIVSSKCNCDCKDLRPFVCEPYGHVITGDLHLVKNINLRNIFKFGSKFRIERFSSWEKVRKSLEEDLIINVKRLSRKFKISCESFSPWMEKIKEVIDKRIWKLSKLNTSTNTNIKITRQLKTAISDLHKDFVISTVDKASSNFAFICKKFFLLVILEELGFDKDNFQPVGNTTYLPATVSSDVIVDRHIRFLKNTLNINCKENEAVLPKIFWIPKLHKDPFKFRFIAGASRCTTKQLSIIINLGLKVIKDNFRKYCDAIYRNSGYNFFWSVNSTFQFLDKIKEREVHSVQVYDFSTLYTNLDQAKTLEHLNALFDLIFNENNRKFLCIRTDKTFFSYKKYNSFRCFDVHQFKEAVKFVVSEVFVLFGGIVFHQVKGIPMGGNCSPLLADLFLAHCEFVFMSELLKDKKFGLARLLSNTSRYIDDLCFLNYKHFHCIMDKIYPTELIAERNGTNDKLVDYLDVKVSIIDQQLNTSVFHKVDDFKFPVILLTFPNSMIPYRMGLNVYAGQVIRYMRICSNIDDFIDKTNRTTSLLISRGYLKEDLQYYLEKFLSKNSSLLNKFGLFSARQVSSLVRFIS